MAFILIFQTVTMEGWSDLMFIYSNGYSRTITTLYFIVCIIICSVFLLNLTIAFLLGNYNELDKAAGFSKSGNRFLMRLGASLGLPDPLVDELLEIDPSGIKIKKTR